MITLIKVSEFHSRQKKMSMRKNEWSQINNSRGYFQILNLSMKHNLISRKIKSNLWNQSWLKRIKRLVTYSLNWKSNQCIQTQEFANLKSCSENFHHKTDSMSKRSWTSSQNLRQIIMTLYFSFENNLTRKGMISKNYSSRKTISNDRSSLSLRINAMGEYRLKLSIWRHFIRKYRLLWCRNKTR